MFTSPVPYFSFTFCIPVHTFPALYVSSAVPIRPYPCRPIRHSRAPRSDLLPDKRGAPGGPSQPARTDTQGVEQTAQKIVLIFLLFLGPYKIHRLPAACRAQILARHPHLPVNPNRQALFSVVSSLDFSVARDISPAALTGTTASA